MLHCCTCTTTGRNDPLIATDRMIYAMLQQCVRDGLLSQEQLFRYAWPFYARSIDEILQPIKAQSNGIHFRVLNPDVDNILVLTEHPLYTAYLNVHHDPKVFAKGMIAFWRPVSYNITLAACDGNREQADRIFERWEEVMATDPAAWADYLTYAFLLLEKL